MKVKSITTTWEKRIRHTTEENLETVTDTEQENEVINLYPEVTYQELEGFGGAATDSAGYVFSLMNEEQKQQKEHMVDG